MAYQLQRSPTRSTDPPNVWTETVNVSLDTCDLSSGRKKMFHGFSFPRSLISPSSGLDQQPADWCSITTSVQTGSSKYANKPDLAHVRGIPWLGRARQRRGLCLRCLPTQLQLDIYTSVVQNTLESWDSKGFASSNDVKLKWRPGGVW